MSFVICSNPGCFNGRLDYRGRKLPAEFEVDNRFYGRKDLYCSIECFETAANQAKFNALVASLVSEVKA